MKFEVKNRLKPCAALSIAIMLIALVLTLMGHGHEAWVLFYRRHHHDL